MYPTHYPSAITPGFMGVKAPPETSYRHRDGPAEYFRNYRNERLSRLQPPPPEWGAPKMEYTPEVDIGRLNKISNLDKFLQMPPSKFSMLDYGRQMEIDNFYKACQMHRDQYKDLAGSLHPLDYFRTHEYMFQCAPDPTSKYLKSPQYYVKYKAPHVLPLTLERTFRSPMLPERALTGRYNPCSDITYKR